MVESVKEGSKKMVNDFKLSDGEDQIIARSIEAKRRKKQEAKKRKKFNLMSLIGAADKASDDLDKITPSGEEKRKRPEDLEFEEFLLN